jgi:hypothetical protein
MRKAFQGAFLVTVIAFYFTQLTYAQNDGGTNIYRTQFFEMREKVKSIYSRTELQSRSKTDYKIKIKLQEDVLALQKLIHRLEEVALEASLESIQSRHGPNKTLLLVSQGCNALDFVLLALDRYVSTDDRSFLSLAREGNALINSVEKML